MFRVQNFREEPTFDRFDDSMEDLEVNLLDPVGGSRPGHDNREIDFGGKFSAAASQQADRPQPPLARSSRSSRSRDDVRRLAAGGERHKEIPCPPVHLDLSREDLVVSEVVGDAREHRRVREGERG